MASLSTPIQYHRLMKHPLDDSEILISGRDLMDYCNSGAVYEGQRVVVNYNGMNIPYKIRNSYPIIDIPEFDPIWTTYNNEQYMLVYYCNGTTFSSSSRFTFLNDPYKFQMMDTLPIFENSSGNYTFLLKVRDLSSVAVSDTTYNWTQNYNPILDYDSHSISPSSGASVSAIVLSTNNSNAYIITSNSGIVLMPKSADSNYTYRLYVKAEDYYTNMGVN